MVSLKPDTENLAPACLEFKQAFETFHECPGAKLVRFHNESKYKIQLFYCVLSHIVLFDTIMLIDLAKT